MTQPLNPYEETLGYLQLLSLELNDVAEFRSFREEGERAEEATRRLLYSLFGKTQRRVNNVINAADIEPLLTCVEAVFSSSRNMTWFSFVQYRLPILDLPDEVLKALREGRIEYTKALALAKIKNDVVRFGLLTKVVQEDLSLMQLRAEIKKLTSNFSNKESSVAERASAVARVLRRQHAIKDARVRKRVEKLLSELEKLLAED